MMARIKLVTLALGAALAIGSGAANAQVFYFADPDCPPLVLAMVLPEEATSPAIEEDLRNRLNQLTIDHLRANPECELELRRELQRREAKP